MLSESQINGELEKFFRYIQNLIKLDNELRWEIRKFIIFIKKTPRKIHRIKNISIWISICKEIKERNMEIEIDREEWQNGRIS